MARLSGQGQKHAFLFPPEAMGYLYSGWSTAFLLQLGTIRARLSPLGGEGEAAVQFTF